MPYGQPKIVYNAGAGNVTLQAIAPVNFTCYAEQVRHDNVASGGAVRESVTERRDLLIQFTLTTFVAPEAGRHDGFRDWAVFISWALAGGVFDLYPNSAIDEHYHCVVEERAAKPQRAGPGVFQQTFVFRVLSDELAPANHAQVMMRFHGVAP